MKKGFFRQSEIGSPRLVLLGFVIALFGIMALSGCSPATSEEAADFTSIYNNSFSVTCQNCHSPGGSASNSGVILDFSSADSAYNDLLNRAVQNISNPSQCMNVRRVQPGNPVNSYLMGVLFTDYNKTNFANVPGCRPSVAHLNYVNLSETEKGNLATWISKGASR